MAGERREVAGVIDGIDEVDMARVLIGEAREEWFFPLDLLPSGASEGDGIRFAEQDGRYTVIGRSDETSADRSIEDRLTRSLMKTNEFDRDEMRRAKAQAEAGGSAKPVTSPAAPRSPVRTRASHQRRW